MLWFIWWKWSSVQISVCICHSLSLHVIIGLHDDNRLPCLRLSLEKVWHGICYYNYSLGFITLSSDQNLFHNNTAWLPTWAVVSTRAGTFYHLISSVHIKFQTLLEPWLTCFTSDVFTSFLDAVKYHRSINNIVWCVWS